MESSLLPECFRLVFVLSLDLLLTCFFPEESWLGTDGVDDVAIADVWLDSDGVDGER